MTTCPVLGELDGSKERENGHEKHLSCFSGHFNFYINNVDAQNPVELHY